MMGSLSIGVSAMTSVFSMENLQMNDTLMEKYQEMLRNVAGKAGGFDDDQGA